jgi:hypothetical protein
MVLRYDDIARRPGDVAPVALNVAPTELRPSAEQCGELLATEGCAGNPPAALSGLGE